MEQSFFAYLGNIAYFLTFVSYAVRNIALLRVLAILASVVAIYYGAKVAAEPLWIPILWNTLFLLVNVAQLGITRWRMRAVALTPLEEFLSKTVLANFPSAEVKSFTRIAHEETLPAGKQLIRMGTELDRLYCLLHGSVHVLVGGKQIADLHAGSFVGEMSLLTQSKTRADVVSATPLRLIAWPHDEIEKWVDADATRLGLLQTAMGRQVVEALLRQQTPPPGETPERAAG